MDQDPSQTESTKIFFLEKKRTYPLKRRPRTLMGPIRCRSSTLCSQWLPLPSYLQSQSSRLHYLLPVRLGFYDR